MKRDYILVVISLVAWGIGEATFFFFQPLYLEELGASPLLIGGILGGVGLGMTLVHIPAGYLADRIGRRKLMWGAWLLGIITTGIMAAARSLQTFSIGLILYSLTSFVVAPLNSYLTAARGKLSVEQAMTTSAAAYFLGGILGPLLGGYLAGRFGLRSIYLASFIVFSISGIIILFIRHQPIESQPDNAGWELLRSRSFLQYLMLVFLVFLVLYLPQPLAPNFLRNQRGIALGMIGVLGSITNLGNVLLNLVFGSLKTRVGLILGQLFVGLYCLVLWQISGLPLLVGAYFLLGGFRATRSILVAKVEKMVDPSRLGLAYGSTETAAGLALMSAPPIAGILYARNPELIFTAPLVLILALALFFILRRKLPWTS